MNKADKNSLKRSKDYKLTVSDFSDIAPVEFAYGSAVINYKVDSVGKFDVVLKELTNEGDVYNIVVAVEDPSNKTTKASQTVEKTDNTSKLDFEKIITYIILGGLATILLIILLIVLIKIKKADNLY